MEMKLVWSDLISPLYDSSDLPEKGGVYLLFVNVGNDQWNCIYCGETDNIFLSVDTHLAPDRGNYCAHQILSNHTCGLLYAKIEDPEKRTSASRFLMDTYMPDCNGDYPNVPPLKVNLPGES